MNLNTLKESEYQELHASKDSLTKHLENITVSLNSPTQLKVQQLDTHTNKNNINTSLFNSSEETLTSDQALRSSHSGKSEIVVAFIDSFCYSFLYVQGRRQTEQSQLQGMDAFRKLNSLAKKIKDCGQLQKKGY